MSNTQPMSKLNTAMLTHHSYWIRDVPARKRFDKLSGTHKTVIAIIGAGITGLSTAIELLDRGNNKVTVLEALVVGGGTAGGSSGHLDAHPEGGPKHFVKAVGETTACEATKFRLDAIDLIEKRIRDLETVLAPILTWATTSSSSQLY